MDSSPQFVSPSEHRRVQRVQAVIKKHGLRVVPFGSSGAIRVTGAGVDLVAASIAVLDIADLVPVRALPDQTPH